MVFFCLVNCFHLKLSASVLSLSFLVPFQTRRLDPSPCDYVGHFVYFDSGSSFLAAFMNSIRLLRQLEKFRARRAAKSAPESNQNSNPINGDKSDGSESSKSFPSSRTIPELYKEKEHLSRAFSLQELREATNNFSRVLKIGEGGFGSVYKGKITPANGQAGSIVVAIKKLNQNSMQGHKEWLAEVQFLGVVSHPNLVKLIGYCFDDGERGIQRLLVYEFMPNRSLEAHLFNKSLPPLPWKKRLQIILGVAKGLAYLHEGLEAQVIYRDFKSSNVLLDEFFNPKLSDFGLAREGPTGDHTHVSTAVVGTYGYAAPEYIETGRLTSQCDIWSFGVVLYEILTGRRALERGLPAPEQKLLNWVKKFPPNGKTFGQIIDQRLKNEYSIKGARKVANLADRCLIRNPKDRPAMPEVVDCLKQALQDL